MYTDIFFSNLQGFLKIVPKSIVYICVSNIGLGVYV